MLAMTKAVAVVRLKRRPVGVTGGSGALIHFPPEEQDRVLARSPVVAEVERKRPDPGRVRIGRLEVGLLDAREIADRLDVFAVEPNVPILFREVPVRDARVVLEDEAAFPEKEAADLGDSLKCMR